MYMIWSTAYGFSCWDFPALRDWNLELWAEANPFVLESFSVGILLLLLFPVTVKYLSQSMK